MKKVLILSDLHCGHLVGLTPPGWQLNTSLADKRLKRIAQYQRAYWDFYTDSLRRHGKFDVVIVNGDCIDGKGEKSGGTECITSDRNEQCEMAVFAIRKAVSAGTKVVMTYGTPYHTGTGEDFEGNIAHLLDADISGHQYLRVDGVTFDVKHKVGSSQIPHGRHTAIAREHLWAQLWTEHSATKKADVLVRCLSEDTEILTPAGWKRRGMISVGDSVCTLNLRSGNLEWQAVEKVTSQNTDKTMIQMKAKGYDALVTHDHTIVYHSSVSRNFLKRPADELAKMNIFRLPVSGFLQNPGVVIPDGVLKLLAWTIAEGNMDAGNRSKGYKEKNNVRLFQRISRSNEIEAVLKEAGVSYTKHFRKQKGQKIHELNGRVYETKEDGIVFYIRQPDSKNIIALLGGKKNIPDWLMWMNRRQFEVFLAEYVRGDGHMEKLGRSGKIFTSNSDLADRLQILLITNGYKAQVSRRTKWGKVNYVVGFTPKQIITAKGANFKTVPYNGATWCVSVPNGTIVTRRNGKAAILGNSHVHYYDYAGGADWLAMTTPALQGLGSKYGTRQCSGTVDFGFVVFETNKGDYKWRPVLLKVKTKNHLTLDV